MQFAYSWQICRFGAVLTFTHILCFLKCMIFHEVLISSNAKALYYLEYLFTRYYRY